MSAWWWPRWPHGGRRRCRRGRSRSESLAYERGARGDGCVAAGVATDVDRGARLAAVSRVGGGVAGVRRGDGGGAAPRAARCGGGRGARAARGGDRGDGGAPVQWLRGNAAGVRGRPA